jgi:predicted ferric reductase
VAGKVVALEHLAEVNVLAVDIQLTSGWRGHAAGQFAFVTFHDDEGPIRSALPPAGKTMDTSVS